MDGSDIDDCSGNFYDSGGSFNRYSHDEDFSTTICPDGTDGTHIQLYLIYLDLSFGDEMCFYDGPNTSSPLIACSDVFPSNGPYYIEATAPNTTGCLTVTFTSNDQGLGDGWEAQINCVPACQNIVAELSSSDPISVPAINGWIDICQGETIEFVAEGIYPQSGQVYNQSDASSNFIWDFGDGTIGFGKTASHTYQDAGGYTVQVKIVDNQGCQSRNFINQRVRVSTTPTFEFTTDFPDEICAGDTIRVENNIFDSNSDMMVTSYEGAFSIGGISSDSFPLPDGDGVAYENGITFGEFTPGQIITSRNDLKSICINIEHSYMKDIQVILVCPNGTEIILQNHVGNFKEIFLGVPFEGDEGAAEPTPGGGYTYCWTPDPEFETWNEEALFLDERTSLPEGNYTSFESFNGFIGCPLNGEWTIRVEDHFALDNGWVFSWNICFADYLIPDIETFTPGIVDWGWEDNPAIIYSDQDYMLTAPNQAGTTNYVFTVTDEFGCQYDTTIALNVLPSTHPDCLECSEIVGSSDDEVLCEGDSLFIDVEYLGLSGNSIPYQVSPNIEFGAASNPPSNPLESIISVAGLSPGNIIDVYQDVLEVCVDIETDATEDLQLILIAPSGQSMRLATNVGGTGDNFFQTCFTTDLTAPPIGSGTAPFTGSFQPEDPWTNLNGAFQNGDWSLQVSDAFGPIDVNTLVRWSITFNAANDVDFFWLNATGLSCSNCPNPVAVPTSDAQYIVRVTDGFGCVGFDTINVSVLPLLGPTQLTAVTNNPGEIEYTWNPIPNATAYEVNINNTGWISPNNGIFSHLVTGLDLGEDITFWVRGVTDPNICDSDITILFLEYDTCLWTAAPVVISDVQCFGQSDAVISANVFNVQGAPTYTLDGILTQDISLFNNVSSGYHFIVIEDPVGCLDTVEFNLVDPPPITIDTMTTPVSCFGLNDGTLYAAGMGGVGDFEYVWSTTPPTFDSTAVGVYAGNYSVTVQDANGCTASETVTVISPDRTRVTASGTDPSCNGGSDGILNAVAEDGTPPYIYNWGNGPTGPTINASAGTYTVMVTDASGCTAQASVVLDEPDPGFAQGTSTDTKCYNTKDGTGTIIEEGNGPWTYSWDDPNTQTTQTATNLAPGVYNFTVSDVDGCNFIGSVTIGAPQELMGEAIAFMATCFDKPDGRTLASANGGVEPYAYLWSDPNSQSTAEATGLLAGIYTVTITDDEGCTNVQSAEVLQPDPIQINIVSTFASCVEVADGTAAATATGGNGSYSFQWNDNASSTTSNISDLAVGIYTLTVTDTNDCTGVETVEITADNALMIDTIVGQSVSCFGLNDGQAIAFVNGGTAPLSYDWDDPLEQLSNPAINLIAGDYSLTVTDDNGCSDVGIVVIEEPDLFQGEIVDLIPVLCRGENTGAVSVTAGGGTLPYAFAWSNSDMDSVAQNLIAGTYTVVVTDANNCSFTAMATIEEPETLVEAEVEQTFIGCFGSSTGVAEITAQNGTGPNYTHTWSHNFVGNIASDLAVGEYYITTSDENLCETYDTIVIVELEPITASLIKARPSCYSFGDGLVGVNSVVGGAGDGSFASYNYSWRHDPNNNTELLEDLFGDTMYYVTITDDLGCMYEDSIFLDEPKQIQMNLTIEDPSCFGYNDGSITVDSICGDEEIVSYEWCTGEINEPLRENLYSGACAVTIVDAKGCKVISIVELKDPPPLEVSFDNTDNDCSQDEDGEITVYPFGGTPPYSVEWSTGSTDNTISNLPNGVYEITIIDSNGCEMIGMDSIVSPAPLAAFIDTENVKCFGDSNGSIEITANGGLGPYQFSFDGEDYSSINRRVGLPAGPYSIFVRDLRGCVFETLIQIGTPPELNISAGEDIFIQIGEELELMADGWNGNGSIEYSWSSQDDNSLSCVICCCPTVAPLVTSTYKVVGVDENGCSAEALITVFVQKEPNVVVPTAFTPNNDNNNDILIVHGKSKSIDHVELFRIYDRWGELVFENKDFKLNDINSGWNGNFRNKEMEAGVYVWYLEVEFLDGTMFSLKGSTTLIR